MSHAWLFQIDQSRCLESTWLLSPVWLLWIQRWAFNLSGQTPIHLDSTMIVVGVYRCENQFYALWCQSTVVHETFPRAQLCLVLYRCSRGWDQSSFPLLLTSLFSLGATIHTWYSRLFFSVFLCVCLCEDVPCGYQKPRSEPLEKRHVLLTSDDTQDGFMHKQIRAQRI